MFQATAPISKFFCSDRKRRPFRHSFHLHNHNNSCQIILPLTSCDTFGICACLSIKQRSSSVIVYSSFGRKEMDTRKPSRGLVVLINLFLILTIYQCKNVFQDFRLNFVNAFRRRSWQAVEWLKSSQFIFQQESKACLFCEVTQLTSRET